MVVFVATLAVYGFKCNYLRCMLVNLHWDCLILSIQIIIQPQSATTSGSQLQLVGGGQLVQMQNGQTILYQPMQQNEAVAQQQQQQIQTIQIQNASMYILVRCFTCLVNCGNFSEVLSNRNLGSFENCTLMMSRWSNHLFVIVMRLSVIGRLFI